MTNGITRRDALKGLTTFAAAGLMAAGQVDHPSVARGIQYLEATQGADVVARTSC